MTSIIFPGAEVKSGDLAQVELFGARLVTHLDFRKNGSIKLYTSDRKSPGIIVEKEDAASPTFKILGRVLEGMDPKRAF